MIAQAIILLTIYFIVGVWYIAGVPMLEKLKGEVAASAAVQADAGRLATLDFTHYALVLVIPLAIAIGATIWFYLSAVRTESTSQIRRF